MARVHDDRLTVEQAFRLLEWHLRDVAGTLLTLQHAMDDAEEAGLLTVELATDVAAEVKAVQSAVVACWRAWIAWNSLKR